MSYSFSKKSSEILTNRVIWFFLKVGVKDGHNYTIYFSENRLKWVEYEFYIFLDQPKLTWPDFINLFDNLNIHLSIIYKYTLHNLYGYVLCVYTLLKLQL